MMSARGVENMEYVRQDKEGNEDNHSLGAVQTVIRGRIRYIWSGLVLIAISMWGLYALFLTNMEFFVERTTVNILISTVLLCGGIAWGVQQLYFVTLRMKLRRYGFEMSSVLGTKEYEYKDCEFYMTEKYVHKNETDGYKTAFSVGNYVRIYECQIRVNGRAKPIIINSSKYSQLKSKMTAMMENLK